MNTIQRSHKPNTLEIQEQEQSCGTNYFITAVYTKTDNCKLLCPKYYVHSAERIEDHFVLTESRYSQTLGFIGFPKDKLESENPFGVECFHKHPLNSEGKISVAKSAEERLYQQAQKRATELSEEYGFDIIDNTSRVLVPQ